MQPLRGRPSCSTGETPPETPPNTQTVGELQKTVGELQKTVGELRKRQDEVEGLLRNRLGPYDARDPPMPATSLRSLKSQSAPLLDRPPAGHLAQPFDGVWQSGISPSQAPLQPFGFSGPASSVPQARLQPFRFSGTASQAPLQPFCFRGPRGPRASSVPHTPVLLWKRGGPTHSSASSVPDTPVLPWAPMHMQARRTHRLPTTPPEALALAAAVAAKDSALWQQQQQQPNQPNQLPPNVED